MGRSGTGTHPPGRGHRRRRHARSRSRRSPTSPRPRCRWTTPAHHRRAAAASPRSRGPKQRRHLLPQNRQDAVRELTRQCDLVLVVGRRTSQFNRLRELANEGVEAHLIDGAGRSIPWVEGRRPTSASPPAPGARRAGAGRAGTGLRGLGAVGVRELDGEPETWSSPPGNCGSGWWIDLCWRPSSKNHGPAGIAQLVERRIRNA